MTNTPKSHVSLPEPPTNTSNAPGILIVDDHDLVRMGLHALVLSHAAGAAQTVKIYEARTLQEALALYGIEMQNIGLVLLDMNLPDAHGLTALITFKQQFPSAHIAILSGISDPALMQEALELGAQAYISKAKKLHQAIDYIKLCVFRSAANEVAVPLASSLEHDVIEDASRFCNPQEQAADFTLRQTQVLGWILAGKLNREIGQIMGLNESTIKNITSTLMLLFGVRSQTQLVAMLR